MEIKNILLNKDTYIFGLDDYICLSFELISEKEEKISDIKILYGYDLYNGSERKNFFQESLIIDPFILESKIPKNISVQIPIKVFNIEEDIAGNYTQNHIYINIGGSIFFNIHEKLYPKIILDPKLIALQNIYVPKKYIESVVDTSSQGEKNIGNLSMDQKEIDFVLQDLNIDGNTDSFTVLTKFDGILFSFSRMIQDRMSKETYDKIMENKLMRFINFLIQSKIYNFIYKYAFIVPSLSFIDYITSFSIGHYIYTTLGIDTSIGVGIELLIALLFLFFILFNKLLEEIYNKKLQSSFYEVRFQSTQYLEENFLQKIIHNTLKITDILEFMRVKDFYFKKKFHFELSFSVFIEGYFGKNNNTAIGFCAYTMTLFKYFGEGNFSLDKINLLNNNYQKMEKLFLSSLQGNGKVYYIISCQINALEIPDLNIEKTIRPKPVK